MKVNVRSVCSTRRNFFKLLEVISNDVLNFLTAIASLISYVIREMSLGRGMGGMDNEHKTDSKQKS